MKVVPRKFAFVLILDESVFYLEHRMIKQNQPNKSWGKEVPLLISAELAEMGDLVVQKPPCLLISN